MEKSSLLHKIKSKYILQEIFCLAYEEMKSVLKLVKYNKSLLNKLEINIKEKYKYKIEKRKDIYMPESITAMVLGFFLIGYFFTSIVFLIYIVKFYVKGKFNEENLKDRYNVKKKKFIEFMDSYILLIYFGFIIALIIFISIYICYTQMALGRLTKLTILSFNFFVEFTHYIAYIIKLAFSIQLIKKEIESKPWFYSYDIGMIILLSPNLIYYLLIFLSSLSRDRLIDGDCQIIFIKQLYGINIYKYELPYRFGKVNDKKKNEIIFKKENLAKYEYILSNSKKIDLILNKINDIRAKNKIPLLTYNEERHLPDFIINEKTKMFFYSNENVYKLTPNLYIFKYPLNEFQNHINNNEVINIITNELLDMIGIIEKNELEYINIYNNNTNNNIQINNNNININVPRIHMDINTNIDIANTEDKFNDISEKLSVTEINNKEENEIGPIRNININKNAF